MTNLISFFLCFITIINVVKNTKIYDMKYQREVLNKINTQNPFSPIINLFLTILVIGFAYFMIKNRNKVLVHATGNNNERNEENYNLMGDN